MARARKDQAEQRRRQILEAAVRVFARGGYTGSRVGDIAREGRGPLFL